MAKSVNKAPKDNREYLPIGEEVLGIGANGEWFKKAPESMYFNELVLAIAYSDCLPKLKSEIKRSSDDGKINMVESGALLVIIEKINGGK